MNKISLTHINLDCFMQQATEIHNQECHEGVICKDATGQLRFEEKADPHPTWERNPHIFEGQYINMARKKDGQLKFNFKKVKTDAPDFEASAYAFRVYSELINALQILD